MPSSRYRSWVPQGVRDAGLAQERAGGGLRDRADSGRQSLQRRRDAWVAPVATGAQRRGEFFKRAAAPLDDLGKQGRHRRPAGQGGDRVGGGAGQRRAGQAPYRQASAGAVGAVHADVRAAARVARTGYEYVDRAQPRHRSRRPDLVQSERRRARKQGPLPREQERGAQALTGARGARLEKDHPGE